MPSTAVEIVMSSHVNGIKRLFGGQLMSWIDVIGAVEARRWAKCDVTTVTVDDLTFLKPAFENDTVVLEAKITWTGKTSMEVRVDTFVEHLTTVERTLINRAYLVYVAIKEDGVKVLVPQFEPTTDEEKTEWHAALIRKEIRSFRR